MIIATGAEYRKLAVPNLAQFEGAGVYYGATFIEAQAVRQRRSGGGRRRQLRRAGGRVPGRDRGTRAHARARRRAGGEHVALSIRRIEDNPAISLRPRTEIAALEGTDHLERVRWRDNRDGPGRDARHQARLRHDRCASEHRTG